ncbi:MAG: hypothetical protein LBT40_02695 [Deltaproteobacteria bacterium]|nr:hypothetical protein [Deltaproteobacteria bacterium]
MTPVPEDAAPGVLERGGPADATGPSALPAPPGDRPPGADPEEEAPPAARKAADSDHFKGQLPNFFCRARLSFSDSMPTKVRSSRTSGVSLHLLVFLLIIWQRTFKGRLCGAYAPVIAESGGYMYLMMSETGLLKRSCGRGRKADERLRAGFALAASAECVWPDGNAGERLFPDPETVKEELGKETDDDARWIKEAWLAHGDTGRALSYDRESKTFFAMMRLDMFCKLVMPKRTHYTPIDAADLQGSRISGAQGMLAMNIRSRVLKRFDQLNEPFLLTADCLRQITGSVGRRSCPKSLIAAAASHLAAIIEKSPLEGLVEYAVRDDGILISFVGIPDLIGFPDYNRPAPRTKSGSDGANAPAAQADRDAGRRPAPSRPDADTPAAQADRDAGRQPAPSRPDADASEGRRPVPIITPQEQEVIGIAESLGNHLVGISGRGPGGFNAIGGCLAYLVQKASGCAASSAGAPEVEAIAGHMKDLLVSLASDFGAVAKTGYEPEVYAEAMKSLAARAEATAATLAGGDCLAKHVAERLSFSASLAASIAADASEAEARKKAGSPAEGSDFSSLPPEFRDEYRAIDERLDPLMRDVFADPASPSLPGRLEELAARARGLRDLTAGNRYALEWADLTERKVENMKKRLTATLQAKAEAPQSRRASIPELRDAEGGEAGAEAPQSRQASIPEFRDAGSGEAGAEAPPPRQASIPELRDAGGGEAGAEAPLSRRASIPELRDAGGGEAGAETPPPRRASWDWAAESDAISRMLGDTGDKAGGRPASPSSSLLKELENRARDLANRPARDQEAAREAVLPEDRVKEPAARISGDLRPKAETRSTGTVTGARPPAAGFAGRGTVPPNLATGDRRHADVGQDAKEAVLWESVDGEWNCHGKKSCDDADLFSTNAALNIFPAAAKAAKSPGQLKCLLESIRETYRARWLANLIRKPGFAKYLCGALQNIARNASARRAA